MLTTSSKEQRDHGGDLDAAVARWGGERREWIDLSTGVNPVPYPRAGFPEHVWTALPDRNAQDELLNTARRFWNVPNGAAILAAPGASALIARIPSLFDRGRVDIPPPTYNEHAAAFAAQGWVASGENPNVRVVVHPNNPTGKLWSAADLTTPITVIDESFCDVTPTQSLIHLADQPGRIILKSFGKFWGLAGLRLGFAIAHPDTIDRLGDLTGPWAVSGPALHLGAKALRDDTWADVTRQRLSEDASRLDALMTSKGASLVGGTSLFRLYHVNDAASWQNRLAENRVWSRIFPYSTTYMRLGLPAPDQWDRLEAAV